MQNNKDVIISDKFIEKYDACEIAKFKIPKILAGRIEQPNSDLYAIIENNKEVCGIIDGDSFIMALNDTDIWGYIDTKRRVN